MTANTPSVETQKYHWLLVAYSFKRREISGTGSFTHGVLDEGQSTNITKSDLSFMKKTASEKCGLINDDLLDCLVLSVSFLGTMTKDEFHDEEIKAGERLEVKSEN